MYFNGFELLSYLCVTDSFQKWIYTNVSVLQKSDPSLYMAMF